MLRSALAAALCCAALGCAHHEHVEATPAPTAPDQGIVVHGIRAALERAVAEGRANADSIEAAPPFVGTQDDLKDDDEQDSSKR